MNQNCSAVLLCYQCNQIIVLKDPPIVQTAAGQQHPVCCIGCQLAAQTLEHTSTLLDSPAISHWQHYDLPEVQKKFVFSDKENNEITISAEEIHCASCCLLIEREFNKIDGLLDVDVNVTKHRVHLRWHSQKIKLSALLEQLAALGFTPQPLSGDVDADVIENRTALKRILVAGLGMMQVMMYAVGLYAGMFQGISNEIQNFLHVISMLVATPVVLYSGYPFFKAAWRDMKYLQPGMDVPVALAITIAYSASVYAVFIQQGTVYFDSVSMFIFFLSLGRFAEMKARHRAGAATEAFANLTPSVATQLESGIEKTVAVESLSIADILIIKPGETIPIDCRIISGETEVDESLLTGESHPIPKMLGDTLIGGSVNHSGILTVEVEKIGEATVLSHIGRLLRRAQSERPPLSQLADRVARYFVSSVILIAIIVGVYWAQTEPERALEIILAVLVVTCPCALSLATPAALTVAIGRLAHEGLLVTRAEAIEQLARSKYALFDKTGTLTFGKIKIRGVYPTTNFDESYYFNIAAALECKSEHPIAAAFKTFAPDLVADRLVNYPSYGFEGRLTVNEKTSRYRIGKASFVAELSRTVDYQQPTGRTDSSWVALGDEQKIIAWFELGDIPRPDVGTVCAQLKKLGLQVEMMSGDQTGVVNYFSNQFSIQAHAQLSPNDKLNNIRSLQKSGDVVLMVGDGVNDAPVLAGANVSIAMSSGSHLAQTSADMILLHEHIKNLPLMIKIARRTLSVIKQNIAWAIAYNMIALPMAAMGLISPWLAAIGMSSSSLLVVLNALRLSQRKKTVSEILFNRSQIKS